MDVLCDWQEAKDAGVPTNDRGYGEPGWRLPAPADLRTIAVKMFGLLLPAFFSARACPIDACLTLCHSCLRRRRLRRQLGRQPGI